MFERAQHCLRIANRMQVFECRLQKQPVDPFDEIPAERTVERPRPDGAVNIRCFTDDRTAGQKPPRRRIHAGQGGQPGEHGAVAAAECCQHVAGRGSKRRLNVDQRPVLVEQNGADRHCVYGSSNSLGFASTHGDMTKTSTRKQLF